MVSIQGCGFLDHFKNIFSSSSLLSFSFYSLYLQTDLISLEYYSQDFSVLSFCSTERERAPRASCWWQWGQWDLRGACLFLPVTVRSRPPQPCRGKLLAVCSHHFKGRGCRGAVRDGWWGVHTDSRARSHTYTHHSDRWPIEIISELFCGCYDNQCSLGFHLAMWQGLWRQLEAEPVAEPTQAKACERLGGCWLPPLLSTLLLLRPRGCGAWTVKSCTSAVWGNQFALYTIVRRVYKSQWLSPLSHLLQVCLHEQLLLYPEAKIWSSFELFIWGGISGIWLNLDSCSGK